MNWKHLLCGMILLSCLCFLWANPAPCFSSQSDQAAQTKNVAPESSNKSLGMVIKTYTLKHIKPEEFLRAARLYLTDSTSYGNTINVVIWEGNVQKFEELLNKLDVEKKTIQFQVFAIVASRDREEVRQSKEIRERSGPVQAVPITLIDVPTNQAAPAAAPSSKITVSAAQKEKYAGETISLKFKEADLRDVVLYLAEFAHLNVVFDADVRGVVTCNLENIPWDQALEIILKQNNMGKTIEGKVLRVAPLRILNREQNPEKSDTIENRELKRVLDELKTLWNFKTYEVDGPSFVTVREDSGPDNFKLVTNRALNLVVSNVKVMGDEPGKRTVSIEQLKLTGMTNFTDYVFVDTHDVTLKEKGYLVAGVSGYGSSTNALILVISAEIK
jgi:type II secretory pathway component GspD/PulD (secretin)